MSTATNLAPTVREREKKRCVSRQPVQLGDHQTGAGDFRQLQRLQKFKPVYLPPAVDLGEPRQDIGAAEVAKSSITLQCA